VNSGHTLFFRAIASRSKILNVKSTFNTLKNSGQTLYSGQAQFAKKSWKIKKYFNAVKIFRANSVFQDKCKLFKIVNDKKYIFNRVISGRTLFFRASASYSTVLKDKKYFNTAKKFRATLFFRASARCLEFWMIKISDLPSGEARERVPALHNHEMCKTS